MNTPGSNGSPRSAPPSSLPSARQMAETIGDFEQLWLVVPRSARPVNKGLYERIRRQLARTLHYVEAHATQFAAAAAAAAGAPSMPVSSLVNGDDVSVEEDGEGESDDESPLLLVMRIVRTLSPEQWEQVQLLMRMRELSDVGRAEVFFELGETHCTDCGAELDPDDPHEDCPAAIGDEPALLEQEANGGAAPPAQPLSLSPVVSPVAAPEPPPAPAVS